MAWLAKHDIPYDEIHFGKPWPGSGGFYVDDRAIRPSEFRRLSYQQITQLLTNEQTTPVA
jgi:capsule biosynthesis phosphatase